MFVERRKHPRIGIKMVSVEMESISDSEVVKKGTIKGISAGGIGIEMQESFKEGDIVILSFDLGRGYKFNNLNSKVVRIADGLFNSIVGVQFIELAEKDSIRIQKYVNGKLKGKDSSHITSQGDTVIFK